MRKKMLSRKKAVVGSLLATLIICSASTVIPLVQGSMIIRKEVNINPLMETKDDYTIQLRKIFEVVKEKSDNREYKAIMRSLRCLQRHYLVDKSSDVFNFDLESLIVFIESQDEETKKIAKNMIEETYLMILALDGENNGENTDDYYFYRMRYDIFKVLTLNMPYPNWLSVSGLVIFIGFLDIFLSLILVGLRVVPTAAAIIFATFTALIPLIYVDSVLHLGAWLTSKSIDMAFYVIDNTTEEPIDGLTITAEPLDNRGRHLFPVQEAGQRNIEGWYFIPKTQSAPMEDVPPGIHYVIIDGCPHDYEIYEFNTTGIPMGGRYGKTIRLDQIQE